MIKWKKLTEEIWRYLKPGTNFILYDPIYKKQEYYYINDCNRVCVGGSKVQVCDMDLFTWSNYSGIFIIPEVPETLKMQF